LDGALALDGGPLMWGHSDGPTYSSKSRMTPVDRTISLTHIRREPL